MKILCVTSNNTKFNLGQKQLEKYDITLVQTAIEIDEIQGEDVEVIIRDKAKKAYTALNKPVIVTDDSWTIPGLGGFPGPYMKSINHWFTPDDFIRLTKDLADRRIYLNQLVAYQDEIETVIFKSDVPGELSKEARGTFGPPIMKVAMLDGDNGLTISQIYDKDTGYGPERLGLLSGAWEELGTWLSAKSF